jgi:hypothetical protein
MKQIDLVHDLSATETPVAAVPMDPRPHTPRELFSKMDSELVRVLEDLVYVLIDKGVITLQELPEHAQAKLLDRRGFRDRIQKRVHQNGEFIDALDDSKFGLLR